MPSHCASPAAIIYLNHSLQNYTCRTPTFRPKTSDIELCPTISPSQHQLSFYYLRADFTYRQTHRAQNTPPSCQTKARTAQTRHRISSLAQVTGLMDAKRRSRMAIHATSSMSSPRQSIQRRKIDGQKFPHIYHAPTLAPSCTTPPSMRGSL